MCFLCEVFAVFGPEVDAEGVLAAGDAVDCAAAAQATMGSKSRIARARGTERILDNEGGVPCIIPLYSDLDAAGAAREPVA